MYGRLGEDLAWIRLLDAQREAENRRLYGAKDMSPAMLLMGWMGELLWRLTSLRFGRPTRAFETARFDEPQSERARDVA